MTDRSRAADDHLPIRDKRPSWLGGLVQVAPGPETPEARDRKGAQAGMALALVLGGAFWAVAGAAALFFLRR